MNFERKLQSVTEKEIEILKEAIVAKREFISQSEMGWSEKERGVGICDAVIGKIESASQPKLDVLITSKDLFQIVSLAKRGYHDLHADIHISNKKVEQNDFRHISLANAVILWLNEKNLLKRLVIFDYTDHSCQYEETD